MDSLGDHLAAQLRRFGFGDVEDVLAGRAAASPDADASGRKARERELVARLQKLIAAANQRKGSGRSDEARALFEQAASVAKELVEDFSDIHLLDAARCHHDLGIAYAAVGEADDAVEAFTDAVGFWRRSGPPSGSQRPYAGSLTNLGHCLAELGLVADAIEATQKAVDVLRPLVDDDPVDLSKLALALSNLGTFLVRVDRSGEAVAPAQEAVDLYRRLAATDGHSDPFAFARALNNLGEALRKRGRWGRARAAFREAKAVYPG
nr:tetratricopeptide repeat protein [Nocardioides panzhihuensis]